MIMQTMLLAPAFGLSAVQAPPVPARFCPADTKLARLIAASDLVFVGRMDVPKQRLIEEARKPSREYLEIPIRVEDVVKGSSTSSATFRFHPQNAAYKPSNEAVLGLAGNPAMVFLTRADNGPVGLYFAGYTPDALQRATDVKVAAAHAEVSRQERILASWHADTALPRFAEVRALVARLGQVSGDQQQQVFDRLERLGKAAVPAIVAQMDDRRALRTQAVSLTNHAPDAFERMRHYRPTQVVDGLDAMLNQMTGESFGSIVNGGSDRQRAATVAGWRIYAADLTCKGSK